MLTFSTPDLLDATIQSAGSRSYRTKTSTGFRGRKATSLAIINGKEQQVVGGIDWREKELVVEGKSWELSELKSKVPGPSHILRVWHWGEENYKVNIHGNQWRATRSGQLTPLVTFTQAVQNFFSASQPARLCFHVDMPETDRIFFILIMIYSEIRRRDEDADGHLD
ncbi:hypothetical protein Hypma_012180 [Hypsizygus marmoreus]|uniref:Uncharacterized protein n=1 Tax=Hypsizygus marmoreus TaxID=39966 RepID=A0A369JPF5_HYPMA|nr:hypothetical protein Hypma_012180 [Hypsizygus marmoreus]